jgi:hypothetical protein
MYEIINSWHIFFSKQQVFFFDWCELDTNLCDKVCKWLAGGIFSRYTGFLHQDITEIINIVKSSI